MSETANVTQRKNISVRPGRPAHVWSALELHCKHAGRSMSSVVIDAVETHLASLQASTAGAKFDVAEAEGGYEALAAQADDEDRAYHAAMRQRRRDHSEDGSQ